MMMNAPTAAVQAVLAIHRKQSCSLLADKQLDSIKSQQGLFGNNDVTTCVSIVTSKRQQTLNT